MEEILAKLSSSTQGVYYRDNFVSYKEIMENVKKISELIKNSKYHIGRNIGIYIEPDAIHIMKRSEYSGKFGDYSSFSDELDKLSEPETEEEEA